MGLEIVCNNKKRYIRIAESVWTTLTNGEKAPRKHVIANIGPVSRFDDGKPDFEERVKKSFQAGTPIIPELLPYVFKQQPTEKYSFQITEGSDDCIGHPELYSHCILERILEELDVISVLRTYKGFSKLKYDLLGYFRLMVYGRILSPASKIATVRQNDLYYQPILKDSYDYHVYDTLDFIYDHKRQILNRMNSAVMKKFNRKTDVIYYDVTNFYYEIEEPDEDVSDDNGDVIRNGLRKMGVSKENRRQPIVQMGLFMDNSGIPISCEVFPGNTLDHLTVRSALKKSVDNMDFGRFVFVGDRGMCAYTNLLYIIHQGNGYIVSKSIAKSRQDEREWIYDENGYTVESEMFRCKSRIITRTEKDENGRKVSLTEKVVVYWDQHFYERDVKENESFLEFLDKLIRTPENFRITATQSKNVKRFLKNKYLNTETGEISDSSVLRPMIDEDKIAEFKKTFGYYQIITSELNMSEKEIIEIYHGLSRIEDQFRVMKGELSTRPLYVKTPEHIEAHLTVCLIALTVLRIIQKRITDSGLTQKSGKTAWSYGISADRIQTALNKWTVDKLPDEYFRFNNLDDPDLKLILDAFDIHIPVKLFRLAELKTLKTEMKIST